MIPNINLLSQDTKFKIYILNGIYSFGMKVLRIIILQ